MAQVSINIDGVPEPLWVDEDAFKALPTERQNALVADAKAQYAKGARSSLGGTPPPDPTTTSDAGPDQPQFDQMGNPTGTTTPAPAPNQMPYGTQMGNVAQGVGDVSKVLANGMTMGFADKGVAALRAATGDAPDYASAIAQERAQTDAVGAGTPGLNTAIKGAGGVLTGAGLLRAGLSAGGAAMNAGAPLAVKALGFGADAAGAGAAQAVGNLDNVTTTGLDGRPVVSSPHPGADRALTPCF